MVYYYQPQGVSRNNRQLKHKKIFRAVLVTSWSVAFCWIFNCPISTIFWKLQDWKNVVFVYLSENVKKLCFFGSCDLNLNLFAIFSLFWRLGDKLNIHNWSNLLVSMLRILRDSGEISASCERIAGSGFRWFGGSVFPICRSFSLLNTYIY